MNSNLNNFQWTSLPCFPIASSAVFENECAKNSKGLCIWECGRPTVGKGAREGGEARDTRVATTAQSQRRTGIGAGVDESNALLVTRG